MNSVKVANSSAIRAEVRRHETVKNSITKLFKQLERIEDEQLRSGLKVYLHSVQASPSERQGSACDWTQGPCALSATYDLPSPATSIAQSVTTHNCDALEDCRYLDCM
ncbi:hypothetical protein SKAU_G00150570 [Synaphobranchus kaupii]|uniref:Uncharacterized protein n=1 Tax=Synaphobranchus kaupii TaxID=118154 RepID=A0A9Q1IYX2_SYNKA|nr:hypothetical protein SKAU_G00150570 [Synaphobranchus kaupii]